MNITQTNAFNLEVTEQELRAIQQAFYQFFPSPTVYSILASLDEALGESNDDLVTRHEGSIHDDAIPEVTLKLDESKL